MSVARAWTQTTRSRVKCTNHDATKTPYRSGDCGSNQKTSKRRSRYGYFLEQHNPFHSCRLEQNATRSIANFPKWAASLSQIIPKQFVRLYQNCTSSYLIGVLRNIQEHVKWTYWSWSKSPTLIISCRLEHYTYMQVRVSLLPPKGVFICLWKQLNMTLDTELNSDISIINIAINLK